MGIRAELSTIFDIFPVRAPTQERLAALVAQQAVYDVTYSAVGTTLTTPPEGYHVASGRKRAGTGQVTFRRGRSAIREWKAHAAMGMTLEPSVPELEEGNVMAFAMAVQPPLPLFATGCCRIVQVIDEPRRFGFVYGTLPHHPESGEEAFMVHHHDDDVVEFEIIAFSKANSLATKVTGPIARRLQRRALNRYLDGFVMASASITG